MKLTKRLISFLNRVFNKSPLPFLALRITCDGTDLAWTIADDLLTIMPVNSSKSSAQPLTINLHDYTVASLATFLAAQQGYSVPYCDSSAYAQLSALVLLDATGTMQINGDLFGYTSVLWAYMDANAAVLQEARRQIGNMLQQMNTVTASGSWLDFLGAYYGVSRNTGELDAQYGPRIIATVIRPLGNNVAIESALRVLNGGLAASVADYDAPTNNSYGLFDVNMAVSLAMLDANSLSGWQAAITNIVAGMRDAGTFMRQITIDVPVEATQYFFGVIIAGSTVYVYPSDI